MTDTSTDITTSNSLADLAARINAAHLATIGTLRTVLSRAIEAGELLMQAQAQIAHGQWLPWLRANTELEPRVAQNYMRLAAHKDTLVGSNTNSDSYLPPLGLGIEAALELIRQRKGISFREEFKSLQEEIAADREARWQRIEATMPEGTIAPETLRLCTGVYLQQVDDDRANQFHGKEKYCHAIRLTANDAARVRAMESEYSQLIKRACTLELEAEQLREEAAQVEKQIRHTMRRAFVRE